MNRFSTVNLNYYILTLFFLLTCSGTVAGQEAISIGPITLDNPTDDLAFPGDELRYRIQLTNTTSSTHTPTLLVNLPASLLVTDPFWSVQVVTARRTVAPLAPNEVRQIALAVRVDKDFPGSAFTFSVAVESAPEITQQHTQFIAQALTRRTDTVRILQDTTAGTARRIAVLRQAIRARRGPVRDYSPTAAKRVSGRRCPALDLAPPPRFLPTSKKNRCSCITLRLAGAEHSTTLNQSPAEEGCEAVTLLAEPGDTLTWEVATLDRTPLRDVLLETAAGVTVDRLQEVASQHWTWVLPDGVTGYRLYIRAPRTFKVFTQRQYIKQRLVVRPPIREVYRPLPGSPIRRPTDPNLRDNIFDGLQETTQGTAVVLETSTTRTRRITTDTLLYPVVERSLEVVAQRNPLGRSEGHFLVEVPLTPGLTEAPAREELHGIAYWVGIGSQAVSDYDELVREIPGEWTSPGVSAPLAAYAVGHPVVLPGLPAGDAAVQSSWLRYDFFRADRTPNLSGTTSAAAIIQRSPRRPNYGRVRGADLGALLATEVYDPTTETRLLRFQLAFENRHAVNTLPIRLIVVATYRITEEEQYWVTEEE